MDTFLIAYRLLTVYYNKRKVLTAIACINEIDVIRIYFPCSLCRIDSFLLERALIKRNYLAR